MVFYLDKLNEVILLHMTQNATSYLTHFPDMNTSLGIFISFANNLCPKYGAICIEEKQQSQEKNDLILSRTVQYYMTVHICTGLFAFMKCPSWMYSGQPKPKYTLTHLRKYHMLITDQTNTANHLRESNSFYTVYVSYFYLQT